MRILCVDDDEDTCQLLTLLLGNSGFEAVCVPDATTALRLMAREQFRLYILDGQLPGISGLTLCQRIRQRDLDTPVLIFSGHGYESDRVAGWAPAQTPTSLNPTSTNSSPPSGVCWHRLRRRGNENPTPQLRRPRRTPPSAHG